MHILERTVYVDVTCHEAEDQKAVFELSLHSPFWAVIWYML